MAAIVTVDSVTRLRAEARGAVVVCGSHGAPHSARLAAQAGVRGVVLNDAGIGMHGAGVAGIAWLDRLGIAACAIDYRSARIGDAADMLAAGVVSTVNDTAARHGCLPGQTARLAAECLQANALATASGSPAAPSADARAKIPSTGHRDVWALDSIGLARATDRRAVLVTGSHGGLLGGKPDGMLEADVFAAFFNDAGGGKDGAGYARLPELDRRAIAAATVDCNSARVGDGRSTYETGVLSRVNAAARRLELSEGMTMREAVARLVGLA